MTRRGFSLIEAAGAFIILAILLAIAIPSYLALTQSSRTDSARQELLKVAESAQAKATSRRADSVSRDDIERAVGALRQGRREAGETPTEWRLRPEGIVSTRHGEVALSVDGTLLAMVTRDGNCVVVEMVGVSSRNATSSSLSPCTAAR